MKHRWRIVEYLQISPRFVQIQYYSHKCANIYSSLPKYPMFLGLNMSVCWYEKLILKGRVSELVPTIIFSIKLGFSSLVVNISPILSIFIPSKYLLFLTQTMCNNRAQTLLASGSDRREKVLQEVYSTVVLEI